jgi:hypothetical protein
MVSSCCGLLRLDHYSIIRPSHNHLQLEFPIIFIVRDYDGVFGIPQLHTVRSSYIIVMGDYTIRTDIPTANGDYHVTFN